MIATLDFAYIHHMKHVSILPMYGATLTSIDSAHQTLTRVNDFMKYQGKPAFYDVEIVGLAKKTKLGAGLYDIHADKTITGVKKTDVIVLPLLCGDFPTAISKNKKYKDWVIAQYHNNAEIVCLCVGSFFLASTGLLANKKCAVHWARKTSLQRCSRT